jgi:hypothetical protein
MKAESKIYTQHEENVKWASELEFYRDEIKVMENRLAEVARANSSRDILAMVEQFQNRLIVQKNNINALKHRININNHGIENEIKKNKTAVDHRSITDHSDLREQFGLFEKSYRETKTELNLFLVKWM